MNRKSAIVRIVGLVLGACLALSVAFAKEGGSGSHGGGFVLCRPAAGKPTFELADVYEGRTQRGYLYHRMETGNSHQYSEEDLRRGLPKKIRDLVEDSMKWIDAQLAAGAAALEDVIAPVDDVEAELLGSLRLPPECRFIQAAKFFDGPDHLTWSWRPLEEAFGKDWNREYEPIEMHSETGEKIFVKLSGDRGPSDVYVYQVKVHEAIYKLAREKCGDRDSRRTRKIVALLFSDFATTKDFWDSGATFREIDLPAKPAYGVHIGIARAYRLKHVAAKRALQDLLSDLYAGKPFVDTNP